MIISGFIKNSFVDFPGVISSVIFTNGCNLNCWYCHNHQLIDGKYDSIIDIADILQFLEKRKGMIDGVVVSGGEPTLQSGLKQLLTSIKNMGFKTKLDTNGTNYQVVEDLCKSNLLDYVAVDIKASSSKYENIVGGKFEYNKLIELCKMLKVLNIDFEIRTTFVPTLCAEDICEIAQSFNFANKYFIQHYNKMQSSWPDPLSELEFEKAVELAKKYIPNTKIR